MADLRLKILLLVVVVSAPQSVVSQDAPSPVYRLPSSVTPRGYVIQLDPDMDTLAIKGTVRIDVITTSNKNLSLATITMHMGRNVDVNVTTAIILKMDGSTQKIGAVIADDANTLLKLQLPENQTLNYNQVYYIKLDFQSVLNTKSQGLFTGFFNSTSKYIASKFRPTYARDFFPCFDEPNFKVPITLQVWRPASYYSISTAPLHSSSKVRSDNKILDSFKPTGPISIHSLGLFIGQAQPQESMGVQVIVPGNLPTNVTYLNNLISAVVKELGPLPIDPLYLIVLPDITHSSFSSYGFVYTSAEVYLGEVGSPLQWTSLQLQLTEELLRQYIEYTRTPEWWSDVWLSESVGAYLSLGFQKDEPWLQDWLNIVIRSEAIGSYFRATGPVIPSEDLTKWDIENIINNQTVRMKGLSTFLMWNNTMPNGLVYQTLKQFISLPQSLVSTSDLVNLMVANINASKETYDVSPAVPLLPNWLVQAGSPLVWFSSDNSTFTLVQNIPCSGNATPALRSISIAVAEGSAPEWNNTLQGRWLLNATSQYSYPNISQSSVINIETAPYRVSYPNSQWNTLVKDLTSNWAPVSVASMLQDDAVALSLGGCLNFSIALSVLNSSQHSSLDWWPVVKAAEAITANIGNDWYGFTAFGKYFATLFTPDLLEALDVRNSANHSELSVARELVTPWLCRFNISSCREAVVQMGGLLWQGNTSAISGSDLENIACYGARYTPDALGALLGAYQNTSSAWLRRYFTIALSCLTEQDSVTGLLSILLNNNSTESVLIKSDAEKVLIGLASSLENAPTVVSFIVSQSTDIQEKFGVDILSLTIKALAKKRVNLEQLSSLLSNTQLDPYVVESVGEAIGISNISQTWYTVYSNQLYQVLPNGDVQPSTTTTTSTSTTQNPGPSPTTTTTTSKPTPSSALAFSDGKVFTLALLAFLITLNFSLQ